MILPTYMKLFKSDQLVGWIREMDGDVVYMSVHKNHWANQPIEHDRKEVVPLKDVPHWVRRAQHLWHPQGLRYEKKTSKLKNLAKEE